VEIISSDKAKTQVYCDLQDLGEQMERAYGERNLKLAVFPHLTPYNSGREYSATRAANAPRWRPCFFWKQAMALSCRA
jgi:hypothetical protein